MALGFDPTYPFLGLLLIYMVYSEWARLDSRYLVGAALLLLIITAVVDAAGETGVANTLSAYVFFLLAGGVVLLLVDHVREERSRALHATRGGRKQKGPGDGDGGEKPEGETSPDPEDPLDAPEGAGTARAKGEPRPPSRVSDA